VSLLNIAIVINTKAKNAANADTYCDALRAADISFQLFSVGPEELDATIKDCLAKHEMLLIGGGDGTIRSAAQRCAHTSVVFGVLPLGTLNHFSKELDLPQNVDETIQAIKQQKTMMIDLAEVNGQIFVNNSSIGFYPKFADKRDAYSENYNKWLSYIPGFIESLKKHKAFQITIKSKTVNCSLRTSFLMISNNRYTYQFPFTIKRESFEKALLGLYYFKHGKLRVIKLIKNWFSTTSNFETLESPDPVEIHFDRETEVTVSLDGETQKMQTPLYYKSLPKALTVLTKSS